MESISDDSRKTINILLSCASQTMNYIDVIIIIPLIWAAYRGFCKGMIIELCGILSLVLGVWGGIHFSDLIADFIRENINEKYEPIISFSLIFIGIVVGVFIIGKLLEKVINLAQLKIANKLAGAIFGIIKIVLIWGFLITTIHQYDQKYQFISPDIKNESLLYQPLIDFSKVIIPAVKNSETFKESQVEI